MKHLDAVLSAVRRFIPNDRFITRHHEWSGCLALDAQRHRNRSSEQRHAGCSATTGRNLCSHRYFPMISESLNCTGIPEDMYGEASESILDVIALAASLQWFWRRAVVEAAAKIHRELERPEVRPFIEPPLFPISARDAGFAHTIHRWPRTRSNLVADVRHRWRFLGCHSVATRAWSTTRRQPVFETDRAIPRRVLSLGNRRRSVRRLRPRWHCGLSRGVTDTFTATQKHPHPREPVIAPSTSQSLPEAATRAQRCALRH